MDKMTVFYSNFTGEIKLVTTGEADFDIFCNNELDMRSFCKRVVVILNDEVLKKSHIYVVDLEKNVIKLKDEYIPEEIKLIL